MVARTSSTNTRYILCPLLLYSAQYLPLITVLPLLYMILLPSTVDPASYSLTFWISLASFGFVIAGYFLAPYCASKAAEQILSRLTFRLDRAQISKQGVLVASRVFLAGYGLAFGVLVLFSSSGMLWLTNSRAAYGLPKPGVGAFHQVAIICLYLAYLFDLFTIDLTQHTRIRPQIAVRCIVYMFLAYFLGSKYYIMNVIVIGLIYYNYNVHRVRLATLILMGALILVGVAALLFMGGLSNALDLVKYADYFQNSAMFLRRFDEFGGYRWGMVALSDLWRYVPHPLYPDKPFVYGTNLINLALFPDELKENFTPSYLPWLPSYWDFGIVGVAGYSLSNGLLFGWAHHYYRSGPPNTIRFFLLIQFGYVQIFGYFSTTGVLLIMLPTFCLSVAAIFAHVRQVRLSAKSAALRAEP